MVSLKCKSGHFALSHGIESKPVVLLKAVHGLAQGGPSPYLMLQPWKEVNESLLILSVTEWKHCWDILLEASQFNDHRASFHFLTNHHHHELVHKSCYIGKIE